MEATRQRKFDLFNCPKCNGRLQPAEDTKPSPGVLTQKTFRCPDCGFEKELTMII